MPSANIQPKGKVINSSAWSLAASAFNTVNYRPSGAPVNNTLSVDTPIGALAGGVAGVSGVNDWESAPLTNTGSGVLGLYSDNAEGAPFENAPAAASGVLAIYMHGGEFDMFVFETNSATNPFGSILGQYYYGAPLFPSKFGLLTPEFPSVVDYGAGVDSWIAMAVALPSASILKLGIKLLV